MVVYNNWLRIYLGIAHLLQDSSLARVCSANHQDPEVRAHLPDFLHIEDLLHIVRSKRSGPSKAGVFAVGSDTAEVLWWEKSKSCRVMAAR